MDQEAKLKIVRDAIKSYPDFPKKGILFRDIFGVFQDVAAMRVMKDLLVEHVLPLDIDAIVGLDSRGFLLGPLLCMEIGKPFVPIRKKGKLPGPVFQKAFTLEYSEATFEIQKESIAKDMRILVIDDLLATGGSMAAAVNLIKACGAVVVECLVLIELTKLEGRSQIDAPVHSLVPYD